MVLKFMINKQTARKPRVAEYYIMYINFKLYIHSSLTFFVLQLMS